MTEERFDRIDDVYERMDGDSRRRFVPTQLLDIQSPEQLSEARELVNNVIAQNITTANQLAKRTGIKPSAISAFRNDKWEGKQGTLHTTASKLVNAIDGLLKAREAAETAIDGYVETKYARAFDALVEMTVKRLVMSAFTSHAGTGKSTYLRWKADAKPGAVLIVVTKCRSSVKSFLQLVARSLGLPEHGRAEDIQDRIVACLHGSGRLILVDEAHKLQVATLDVIREIWDETRVPIVLAGTPSLYTTLTKRQVGLATTELMDQLYSRVAFYRDLSVLENPETGEPERLYNAEDMRKVFARGHVRLTGDGIDFLCRIANTVGSGCLRTCGQLVQMVVDLYPGQAITAGLLRGAMKLKMGTKESDFRQAQAGIVEGPPPAKVAVG